MAIFKKRWAVPHKRAKGQKFYVEREPYEAKGKTYFSHFMKNKVRGIDFKIQLAPPDFGGYKVLEIVYGPDNKAELIVKPFEIADPKTGQTITGNTYSIQSVDKETGEMFECAVKPMKKFDKDLLKMLFH